MLKNLFFLHYFQFCSHCRKSEVLFRNLISYTEFVLRFESYHKALWLDSLLVEFPFFIFPNSHYFSFAKIKLKTEVKSKKIFENEKKIVKISKRY